MEGNWQVTGRIKMEYLCLGKYLRGGAGLG
jgi:hypothetical protein